MTEDTYSGDLNLRVDRIIAQAIEETTAHDVWGIPTFVSRDMPRGAVEQIGAGESIADAVQRARLRAMVTDPRATFPVVGHV